MPGDREDQDDQPTPDERTYAEPDQQATIDGLSPRARQARVELLSAPASAVARPPEAATAARTRGMVIGRYQLLEMVGAGGMGMVWGAWDPELERRVALKLVQPTFVASRERILVEGQALAKLSHPHVVPIYDVGVMGEQVYLVMEWVHGITLRAYARKVLTRRALLEAYRQAGEGLAAAHRAGIVHRDFKPDNVIRGDDGRVRVLDFGLAQSGSPRPASETDAASGSPQLVSGTPYYMAPEQAAGEPALAATDQYAFCIALREALTGLARRQGGKVPGWLTTILTRGLSIEPEQRFASMDELLAALARDPARIWKRRAAGLALVASAATAFAVGRMRASDSGVAPCTGSTAELASSWNPALRDQVTAHLRSLGMLGSEEPAQLGHDLDGYGAAWVAEHRRACLAREGQELTPVLYERRLACLARAKASLATIAELLTSVPAEGLAAVLVARRGLPETAACAAVDDSTVLPPPPAIATQVAAVAPTIERARVLSVAARPEALAATKASVVAAQATGYAPLIARALLVQGRTEASLFQIPEATATLTESLRLALQASDDVLALEAYARWIWVSDFHDPPDSWMVMEQLAQRTGRPGHFGRALLFNNLGARNYRAKQHEAARRWLQRALVETSLETAPASEDVELVAILKNLALIERDGDKRRTLIERAARALEVTLGRNHPSAIATREQAALITRNPALARPLLEDACRGYVQWQMTSPGAACALEAGWLADELGDRAAALRWMTLAATDPKTVTGERAKGLLATAYLQLHRDPASALGPATTPTPTPAAAARAEADTVKALTATIAQLHRAGTTAMASPNWWFRVDAADAYALAALALDRLHRAGEATRDWGLALAALEGIDEPVYERRVARIRATVAERLAPTQPAEARRLAAAALAWYRLAGGYDAELQRLAPIAGP